MKKTNHCFVVLAYQESPFLENCIKSILAQDVKTEVVIATTTDNEYIRKLAKKYNLAVVVGKHSSIGGDFDFARKASDAELVTIAHQDDIYEPKYASSILKSYEHSKDASLIFCDYYEIWNDKKIYTNINLIIKRILLSPAFIKKNLKSKFAKRWLIRFGNSICCPAVTFINRNCPDKVFDIDFSCNVDWHAWEKMSREPGKFVFIPKKLVGHRISEQSATTKNINSGVRTKEDEIMFKRFWGPKIAKIFTNFYRLSEKSNKK